MAGAEEPELELLQANVSKLKDNQFIEYCDITGISRFEELLGIVPSENNNLAERITRVLNRWNEDLPYTYKGLIRKLNILFGEGNYTIKLYNDQYMLHIGVSVEFESQIKELKYFLSYMLPANITTKLDALRVVEESLYVKPATHKINEITATIGPTKNKYVLVSIPTKPAVCNNKYIKTIVLPNAEPIVGTFKVGRMLINDI